MMKGGCDMKKQFIGVLAVLGIVAIGIGIWYKTPIRFVDLAPEDVLEIVFFDGNTGKSAHITDEEEIEKVIADFNSVTLTRDKLSVGYMGFRFKTTIYLKNGEEADGWNNFIINSADTIRKDPFFYKVQKGTIDYNAIEQLVRGK